MWEAMSITDLLDIDGRAFHHWSGYVRDTVEKVDLIHKRLLKAQSQQKSYADRWRRPLEFEVSDHVFLKVMLKR